MTWRSSLSGPGPRSTAPPALNNDYLLAEYLMKRVAAQVRWSSSRRSNTATIPPSSNTPARSRSRRDLQERRRGHRPVHGRPRAEEALRPQHRRLDGAPAGQGGRGARASRRHASLISTFSRWTRRSRGPAQTGGRDPRRRGETSMMLYIAPDIVDMSKAAKDYDPRPSGAG